MTPNSYNPLALIFGKTCEQKLEKQLEKLRKQQTKLIIQAVFREIEMASKVECILGKLDHLKLRKENGL